MQAAQPNSLAAHHRPSRLTCIVGSGRAASYRIARLIGLRAGINHPCAADA
jgi:hypothetical protein